MKLETLAQSLDVVKLTASTQATTHNDAGDITQGCATDLLSDVLAHAPAGGILVTMQVQPSVITVAEMARLRAIIFSCNRVPDERVIAKAAEEGLSLYVSAADTFDIVGRLYALGIRSGGPPGRSQKGLAVKARDERHEAALGSLEPCPEGST